MKLRLLILALTLTLVASSGFAQQDPLDSGAADSLIMVWGHTPDIQGGDSTVTIEAYVLNDVVVGNISVGFDWNLDGFEIDTAYLSATADAAFDFIKILHYKNDVDSSNTYDRFQLVLGRIFSAGLNPGRTHVCTWEGHLTEFQGSDSLLVDTANFAAMKFTEESAPEFTPRYSGALVFKDPSGVSILGQGNLPVSFDLNQNYPNPFNPTTRIGFDVPKRAHVELVVFNVLGQRVTTLVNGEMAPDSYEVLWDGKADSGNKVASGIYFYRLSSENTVMTKKMMLLK